ncbi:MAG: CheR family methyltransferase [Bacteroidota bacterium]
MELKQTYGELLDKDFKRLGKFIYDNYGINLYPQKQVLVKSRLQRRLSILGMSSYSEYCDYVLKHEHGKEEAIHMIDRISTNKTDFFREDDHFDYLSETLLKYYFAETGKKKLRIWSAGCSSGEEPYTIAMVLSEQKGSIPFFDFSIFASDISTTVLKKAKAAVYPESDLEEIPTVYHSKYLLKSKDKTKKQIRITSNIRNKVKFFRYNLLGSKSPFNKPVDVIFCRNTLIYFDRQTQQRVINHLISNLPIGGYLFLGHSESLINMSFPLKNVFPSVYKKI